MRTVQPLAFLAPIVSLKSKASLTYALLLGCAALLLAPPADGQSSPLNRAGAGLVPVAGGSAATGDIDGDGDPDLVVTGQKNAVFGNQTATLYRNEGDGTFTKLDAGLDGVFGGSSAFADVDGDGDLDLLIAGESGVTPTATLYLNDGTGSFTKADAGLTGVQNEAVAVADIDGDGDPDLVVTGLGADAFEANTTVYENDGNGNFSAVDAGLINAESAALDFADIEGDGDPDLILSGKDASGSERTVLYENDGNGNFSAANAGLTDAAPGAARFGDITGDGRPDLFVSGFAEGGRSATLYVNDGSGGFSPAEAGLDPVGGGAAAFGDATGDGALDLVVAGGIEGNASSTTLYENDGQGGLSPRAANLTDVLAGTVLFDDTDGDGDADLLVTGGGSLFDAATRLYVNNTTQTDPNRPPRASRPPRSDTTAAGLTLSETLEIGDPDGDPVTLELTQDGSDAGASFTDRGDGTATFTYEPVRSAAGSEVSFAVEASDGAGASTSFSFSARVPDAFAANTDLAPLSFASAGFGDVDGDADQDVVVTGRDTAGTERAILYESDGQGGLAPADAGLTGVEGGTSRFADIDTDGDLDLLIAGANQTGTATATVYENDGSGSFTAVDAGVGGLRGASAAFGDVDLDGDPDLILAGADQNLDPTATLYLNDGTGGFSAAGAGLEGIEDGSVDLADVEGDGDLDLLLTGEGPSGSSATLYLNDGTGSFSVAEAGLSGARRSDAAFGDLDGDGDPDLVIGGLLPFSPGFTIYENDGSGGFSARSAAPAPVDRASVALGDIDGDGDPDLLVAGEGTDRTPQLRVYENDGDGTFARLGAGLTVGAKEGAVRLGDGNGDGRLDLIAAGQNRSTGNEGKTTYYENLRESAVAARVSQSVGADGNVDFGETGVDIQFAGTDGAGTVVVTKVAAPPSGTAGITEQTASAYRYEVGIGGGLTVGDSTELRLDVGALAGVANAANVSVYRRSPRNGGTFTALPTSVASGEVVATTTVSGEFVLASNTEPLPVELSSFDAAVVEEKVRLAWQTASETQNARFDVQRRTGPQAPWRTVGSVEGAGTTTEPRSYRFTDASPPYEAERLTYRLRQVDVGGTVRHSRAVTVERAGQETELLPPRPNPAAGQVTVRYATKGGSGATLRLYDALGRVVRTLEASGRPGRHERRVDLSGLPAGPYFLRLSADGPAKTRRLTVVR